MKKITLLFAIILLAAASVNAQTYETAVGAKFYTGNGSVGGLNIRHSNPENTALEGSLLFFSGGNRYWRVLSIPGTYYKMQKDCNILLAVAVCLVLVPEGITIITTGICTSVDRGSRL